MVKYNKDAKKIINKSFTKINENLKELIGNGVFSLIREAGVDLLEEAQKKSRGNEDLVIPILAMALGQAFYAYQTPKTEFKQWFDMVVNTTVDCYNDFIAECVKQNPEETESVDYKEPVKFSISEIFKKKIEKN